VTSPARVPFANYPRLVILGLWMLSFMWLLSHNRFQIFLKAELALLLAGGLLLMTMLFVAVYARMNHPSSHPHALSGRALQVALLGLPLAYMLGAAGGSGLGSDAFAKRRVAGQALLSRGPRPSIVERAERGTITLADLATDADALKGRRVTVDGIVYRGAELPPDTFVAFRFVIVCCAADALPVGVHVAGADLTQILSDEWVRVTGIVDVRETDGVAAPWLLSAHVDPIEPPTNVYLSGW